MAWKAFATVDYDAAVEGARAKMGNERGSVFTLEAQVRNGERKVLRTFCFAG